MMAVLGRAAPFLEVLDLSYARQLHNSALEAFVACNDTDTEEELGASTSLPVFLHPFDGHGVRQPRPLRTEARILGARRHMHLFEGQWPGHPPQHYSFDSPLGRRRRGRTHGFVPRCNNPSSPEACASASPSASVVQTGQMLEHLIISSASEMSNAALSALVRNCTRLRVLEADATNISSNVVKEFVRLSQKRHMINAKVVAVDCRAVSESMVRSLTTLTRPRLGWRAHEARRLRFLDARDTREGVTEELKIGQDECDEGRVVIKTFYSWQTVDAVRADREKRRKRQARRTSNESGGSFVTDDEDSNLGDATNRTYDGGLQTELDVDFLPLAQTRRL
ncbi:RNI protein [Salix suchowensis]|nr:RNI protein [Salix suchowensis]